MNQIFNFNGQQVRTVMVEDEPYFVGKDVATILGYVRTADAIRKHVDSEDKGVANLETPSGKQDLIIINEPGLYSLIISSKLPQAKEFKRWVIAEVLPSIRKHGMYATDELLDNPDIAIAVFQRLKEEREQRKALEVQVSVLTPKAKYFDNLVDKTDLINIRDTAKMLKIKEHRFVKYLLDNNFLYRDKKGTLKPYAHYNNDLFIMKEFKTKSYSGVQTLVTPKGRTTFNLLLGDK